LYRRVVSADRDSALYDAIGVGYRRFRQSDARIERMLHEPLGDATRVVNVGAGAGSYEPRDREVVAVEPSLEMVRQRVPGSAPAIRAVASELPFADAVFDAGMALLTVHHWPDPLAGLRELRRVVRGPVVVLTFDHETHGSQWLVVEYLPSMLDLDRDVPSPRQIAEALGGGRVDVVPVAADCLDGFCHAWWQRPHAYLDPAVRAAISGIARLPQVVVDDGMARLRADLASGAWDRRHRELLAETEIDAGYRLVVSPAA
jgi:SAM-dependent methyltransferase